MYEYRIKLKNRLFVPFYLHWLDDLRPFLPDKEKQLRAQRTMSDSCALTNQRAGSLQEALYGFTTCTSSCSSKRPGWQKLTVALWGKNKTKPWNNLTQKLVSCRGEDSSHMIWTWVRLESQIWWLKTQHDKMMKDLHLDLDFHASDSWLHFDLSLLTWNTWD